MTIYDELFGLLRKGRVNSVTGGVLAEALGMNVRRLRSTVKAARREGYPIVSASFGINGGGYWIADTPEEIEACIRCMKHQAGEIWQNVKYLEIIKTKFEH